MKKFLPIAMAAVMSISAVAVSAVSANAVEPLNTPVQYAQVARASLATPKISKAESVYGGVKLTWNKVNGAAKYRVYYKGRKGWTRMVDTTSTSYIDKDVSSGRNYTYTVRCISADGKSFTSGYDSKGTTLKYIAAPEISKLENVNGGVKITWNKVSGATKYRVYYKGRKGWTRMVDTTSTSYIDKDVSSGRNYTYTVRCISADGKSFTSGYDSKGTTVKYIAAPEISKLESVNGGVKISWGKVSGATKYRVYYKGSKGWTRMVDTTSTSYIDKDVSSGRNYTYTVRCISADGKSFTSGYDSKGTTVKYIAAPEISKLESVNGGVKISWGKVSGATKYRVYYKGSKGWTKMVDTTSTSYIDKDVSSGRNYTYTVRCITSDAKKFTSGYNPTGKSVKYVATPKISKLEVTYDGVKLTWNKVAGAEKYRVYYKDRNGWTKLGDTTGTTMLDMNVVSKEFDLSVDDIYYTVRCISKDAKSFTSGYDSKGTPIGDHQDCPEIYSIGAVNNGVEMHWTGDAPKFRVYIKENGSWKRIAETYDNYYVHKGAKSGSNTYTVRGVSKDGKKFTTMFNPTGVTYRYKTSDKTRDAYINYMMNHQSEWMPSLGSDHNLSGVMFLDFDFDGVPELVAQKADSNEYSFHSVVYKFEDGKLKRVGNVNDGFSIYYNKTAKKYEVHDLKISLNVDDGYYWSGNSIITYDGENLFANMYSARGVGEESNDNIYYRYFDGNDKNISRAKYNEINLKQFNNCVNAHMFTEFIATGYGDNSVWGENTTAENKQSLLDAYNSFSYEKY